MLGIANVPFHNRLNVCNPIQLRFRFHEFGGHSVLLKFGFGFGFSFKIGAGLQKHNQTTWCRKIW
jgi:hypothetical protein